MITLTGLFTIILKNLHCSGQIFRVVTGKPILQNISDYVPLDIGKKCLKYREVLSKMKSGTENTIKN